MLDPVHAHSLSSSLSSSPQDTCYPPSLAAHAHAHSYQHIHQQQHTLGQMDPAAAVDLRAFYAYTPNEVKHRKRTTSTQLKVLESVFKRETKPNAALRNDLAQQLDMTARGVQVWFQNRRAKEKAKAGKAAARTAEREASASDIAGQAGDSEKEAVAGPSSSPAAEPSPSPEASSTTPTTAETTPATGSSPSSISLPSAGGFCSDAPRAVSSVHGANHSNLHLLRRGSLPADVLFTADSRPLGPPLAAAADPLARRRSVDASFHAVRANPYAPLARPKSGLLPQPRISRYPHNAVPRFPPAVSRSFGRPPLAPSPDVPACTRHTSIDAHAFHFPPAVSQSPSPLASSNVMRSSLPDNTLYAFSSRTVASPIPGPLPSAGYSFGAATTHVTSPSADSQSASPNPFDPFGLPREDEDDSTSSHYPYSRFGSLASIDTASSATSAYYSEYGSDLGSGQSPACASSSSNPFVGMMSNLGVNDPATQHAPAEYSAQGSNSSSSSLAGAVPQTQNQTGSASEYGSTYSSPPSTASPGTASHTGSDQQQQHSTKVSAPSSELAFALQDPTSSSASDLQGAYSHMSDSPMNSSSNAVSASASMGSGIVTQDEQASSFYYHGEAAGFHPGAEEFPAQNPACGNYVGYQGSMPVGEYAEDHFYNQGGQHMGAMQDYGGGGMHGHGHSQYPTYSPPDHPPPHRLLSHEAPSGEFQTLYS